MTTQCVATGAGKWLVGGQGSSGGDSIIQYSTDGITWSSVNLGNYSGSGVQQIVYGNGRFVALINAERIATSFDGISWTVEDVRPWSGFISSSIGYGNGLFFYRGGVVSNQWFYSTTGLGSWTPGASGVNYLYTQIFAYGAGVYVGAGPDGFSYWTSFSVAPTTVANPNPALKNIVFGNGRFVATDGYAGGSRQVIISTDGMNWTTYPNALPLPTTPTTEDYWRGLTYAQGYFLASRIDSNELAYITDGLTWTLTSGDHLFDSAPTSGYSELASVESGEYLALTPGVSAQVGVCPCAIPITYGEYWARLSNVVVKNISIRL